MVEKGLAVGEIGSSRIFVGSAGVSASPASSPKSLIIFDFGWCDFLSLRASKADILDWMEVEGDMINLCKQAQSMSSSSSTQELYAVAGILRGSPAFEQSLIRVQDFCLVPVGTGPDPSVRRWKGPPLEPLSFTCCCRNRSRNTLPSVNVC